MAVRAARRIVSALVLCGVIAAGCAHDAESPTAPASSETSSAALQITGSIVGVGRTAQFKAAAGATDVTALATWSSSDATVLTVSTSGVVSGKADGTAVVTATYLGAAATITVKTRRCVGWSISGPKVIWLGQTVQWQTDAYDGCITHFAYVAASFHSMNPSVVSVATDNPRDLAEITGLSPGTATLYASIPDDAASALANADASGTVTVLSSVRPPPERLELSWFTGGGTLFSGLVLGQPKQLAARARWTSPIVWDEYVTSSTQWLSSDPSVAVVSSSGVATGLRPGTVTISGSYQGVSRSETLQVGSDRDTLDVTSIDLHADVDPFGRDRFNSRVEYAYTLASTSSGSIRLELRDQATGAGVSNSSQPVVRGSGASVTGGGVVTIPATITTICGTLSLQPTGGTAVTVDLGCKPAHVGGGALVPQRQP